MALSVIISVWNVFQKLSDIICVVVSSMSGGNHILQQRTYYTCI